jgi:hypothetical protein
MTATRESKDNLFEFKQHRALVVGRIPLLVWTRLVRLTWRFTVILPDFCISVGITSLQVPDN